MQISRTNHNLTRLKWEGIKKKVVERVPFDNRKGWDGLRVVNNCGYCYEAKGCCNCSLSPKFCGHDNSIFEKFLYSYVDEGNNIKNRPAYKRAEGLADRMLKRIMQDEKNVYEGK